MSQGRRLRSCTAVVALWVAVAALAAGTGSILAAPPPLEPASWPAGPKPLPADPALEARIEKILAGMTLEEKVGQILQAEIQFIQPEDVGRYHLGSVLSGGGSHPGRKREASPAEWLALADAFYEASMREGGSQIPVFWGIDAVHGHNNVRGATLFPHNVGLGATRDPELLRRIGEVTAREVAVTGIEWTFAPTLAVVQDDRWGRTYESYSEDPEIVATLGAAMVEGLQGRVGTPEFLAPGRVIATAKHFLGDGGTDKGRDQGDNLASEAELRDIHAAGYYTALRAGAQTVMASYNSWHGNKMHGHTGLLQDVLKGRMAFDGLVVGDWNGHGQVPGCTNSSCAAAINAGVDLLMVPEDWKKLYENTLEQARKGEIPLARLDDAVRRNLRVKLRAGLFERGRPSSRGPAGKVELLGAPEHRALAREAVRRSLVLLKNEGGLLPLSPKSRVLVAGAGANDVGRQSGGWSVTWQGIAQSNADFPGATTIWEGIRQAVTAAGGEAILAEDGRFTGEKPAVAIVVFGEEPYAEFQGDLSSLAYHKNHAASLELLERLGKEGIPVVSVFLSGRPLWVNPELNASRAFVAAFLPGSEGAGVADVLFRQADGQIAHDFTGKLSFSWPRTPKQATLDRRDTPYDPLFPIGYGLSVKDAGTLATLPVETGEGDEETSTDVFFSGRSRTGWQLAVTENDGPRRSQSEAMLVKVIAVDKAMQEDAREAHFPGEVAGRVMLTGEPIDIARQSNADLALSFAVLVAEAPTAEVKLGMACGRDCAGRLDITDELKALPAGQWQTLQVRLRCFAQAGADMKKIDVPFELSTGGRLRLRFAEVRLVSAAGGGAPCP